MAPTSFPKKIMQDILYENYGEILKDDIIGTGRWSISHRLVFKYEGKIFLTSYSVGATEYQDEQAWENEDSVVCWEAKEVPVTVIEYRKIEE